MFPRLAIPPLFLGENRRVRFDFNLGLDSGEVIDSQEIEVRVLSGTDVSPSSIISGSASQASGIVTQRFEPTVEGVLYEIQCRATTDGDQILTIAGILAVPMVTTDEGVEQVVGPVIASYDSGIVSGALPAGVLLTADQTANGGLFQVNVFAGVVTISPSGGNIFLFVYFVDADTDTPISKAAQNGLNAGVLIGTIGDVEVVNPKPGTQVLIYGIEHGDAELATYRVQAEVIRL